MRGHVRHSSFASILRLHLIALVLLLVAQEAPAESLGRLFLTPEQRAALELQRQFGTLMQQQRIDSRTGFTVFASHPERGDFHIGNEPPKTLRVGETFKHTAPRAAVLPR